MAWVTVAAILLATLPDVPLGVSVGRGHQSPLSNAFMSAFSSATEGDAVPEAADTVEGEEEGGGGGAIAVALALEPGSQLGPPSAPHASQAKATSAPQAEAMSASQAEATSAPQAEATSASQAEATSASQAEATSASQAEATSVTQAVATSASQAEATSASQAEATSASQEMTAGLSACAPSGHDLSALRLEDPPPGTVSSVLPLDFKFYLHVDGPFDMDEAVGCLLEHLGTSLADDDMDLHLMPNWSEHLVDLWLLKQFRDHPMRTYNADEAQLHISGAPLTASYLAATAADGKCGSMQDHNNRGEAMRAALEASPHFQRCSGCDFLFSVSSPFFRRILGPSLWKFLRTDTQVLFATADRDYHQSDTGGTFGVVPEKWGLINIPYKAHYMLEAAALAGADLAGPRDVSFTFHGKTNRRNGGRDRPQLLKIATRLPGASVRDTDFKDFSSPKQFEALSKETAETYLRSSFCFVPAGDTPTSRRLFDSIAAGCVPIVFADFEDISRNLPFRGAVDWANIAIFAGTLPCAMQDEDSMAQWLQALTSDHYSTVVAGMREKGRAEFNRALSYDTPAVAEHLIREAYKHLPVT